MFVEGVEGVEEEIGWAIGIVDEHHSTTVETVTLEVDLRKVAGDASGMSETEEIGILMRICAPEILVRSETGPWICSVRRLTPVGTPRTPLLLNGMYPLLL